MVKCKICDEYETDDLRGFAAHIFYRHDIKMKDYYDKFIKTENEGICLTCDKPTKFKGYSYGYHDYCCNGCQCRSEERLIKSRNTCLKNYGVDNPSQSKIVKQKKIQTSIKNWDVNCPLQSSTIQDKSRQTSLNKYGTESPNQSTVVKLKQRHSQLKKYDGIGFGSDIIKSKIEKTCVDRYGVDNYSKTDECKAIARNNFSRFNKFGFPSKGMNEDQIFDSLVSLIKNDILRDQIIGGFYPDGVILDLNIIIEIDESYHEKEWAIKHDKKKNDAYHSLGYKVIRINECEWLHNPINTNQKFLVEMGDLI